jgi:hypothetical protein
VPWKDSHQTDISLDQVVILMILVFPRKTGA